MKRILTILLLLLTVTLSAETYYVSTTGNDGAEGTIGSPWLTWQKAFNTAVPGDVVYIRGGTYHVSGPNGGYYRGVSKNLGVGTALNPISIFAYPGETPILDGTTMVANATHNGMYFSNCAYYHLKGLTIRFFTEYDPGGPDVKLAHGVVLYNCNHMTLELCNVVGCGRGFVLDGTTDYTYYLNCDAYNNEDFADDGGYADGFGNNLYGATHACHTTFEGCRAWNNSDDGWDFYSSDGTYRGGYATLNNCWSFGNGYRNGDGVGFKLGQTYSPKETGVQRTVTNCIAANNFLFGFDEGGGIDGFIDQVFYNNTSYNNRVGFYINYSDGGADIILRNNIAYGNTYNTSIRSGVVQDHNSWNSGYSVTSGDFVNLSDAYLDAARQADGSLPLLVGFLHLVDGSDLISTGIDVGLTYDGEGNIYSEPPSLGCFEYYTTGASTVPNVTTALVTLITDTTATCGGDVTDDGGEAVTARGVCWSVSPNPTTALATKTSDGTGTGVYVSSITGLLPGTIYYVRAYATNSEGTDYGEQRIFSATEGQPEPGANGLIKHLNRMIIHSNRLIKL